MSRTYNKVIIAGNVGPSPELRHTGNNTPVTNFQVSTDENHRDKNGEFKRFKKWHRIVCWGKLAEIVVKNIKEGQLVLIEGSLTYRNREKDGIKISITEIKATEVKKWANAIKPREEIIIDEPIIDKSVELVS